MKIDFCKILTCSLLAGLLANLSGDSHAEDPMPQAKLLLLKSGRVVQGNVKPTAGGYMLLRPNGDVLIPFDLVQLEADSLSDAYKKQMRLLAPEDRTASSHLYLAKWCIAYHLYSEAEAELQSALRLEPQREEVKVLLSGLRKNILAPPVSEKKKKTADGNVQGLAFQLGETPQRVKSLAGLPRDDAITFIRTIQPILSNKCGNASCHGADVQNRFHLMPIPPGGGTHRIYLERNLAELMKFVDSERPLESPILAYLEDAHGPLLESIFTGPLGVKQQQAIRDWVVSVSDGGDLATHRHADSDAVAEREVETTSRQMTRTESTSAKIDRGVDLSDMPDLLPDPFDPALFNRQAGSGGAIPAGFSDEDRRSNRD